MAGEIKQFKDVNNNTHKVDILGVEGLQAVLDERVKSLEFTSNPTSESPIVLGDILTSNHQMGMFHIYNGGSATTLSSLFNGGDNNIQIYGFESTRQLAQNEDVLCSICRHYQYYIVFVHEKAKFITSLSSSSTNMQYPSAKCVYDELQAIKARLTALES